MTNNPTRHLESTAGNGAAASKAKSRKPLIPANRRRRPARRRLFEALESKSLLTGSPQLIDINPAGASAPSDFLQIGNITYFVADDGTHGRELWKTDGTTAGTELVRDIVAGADSSTPSNLVNLNGVLYFAASDAANGEELWRSDGTAGGTQLVRDIQSGTGSSSPRELTAYNGAIYFSAQDANGKELWKSDGTASGTTLVNDLFPGTGNSGANSSTPRHFAVSGGSLYFSALGSDGLELWKSDGTTSGTMQVKDIYTGTYSYYDYGVYPNSANPTQLTNVNGTLFFAAMNQEQGTELWKTNGTDAGTVLVKDIHTGTSNQGSYGVIGNASSPHLLTALAGTLYFVADDGLSGMELWKSDGTDAGTSRVADIAAGSTGGLAATSEIKVLGNVLYFAANDGVNGVELWRSDGTAAGTYRVSDIAAGATSSNPIGLTVFANALYFSATTDSAGPELWTSDGTTSGTFQVADTVPGTTGVAPTLLATAAGGLLFTGDTGANRELYSVADSQASSGSVDLSIFINRQQVTIPANVGVSSGGGKADAYTTDATGQIHFDSTTGLVSLGTFFDVWREAAALAGNNAAATLSTTQLMGNTVDRTHTLQLFVNGQLSTDADQLLLHDGDQIALVYGADPVVSLNTNFGSILIDLYAAQTPGTVANFLNYVNNGDYVDSFFHRSVHDFVIQGGGFVTTSTTFTNTGQFDDVITDPPITNEPGISNLRGTIAMAKLGGDPNSATSQFFVNLSDDNTFLDSAANNAFTVFGQILGMSTVDAIAALPINTNNASPFDELPLSASNQLVVVQSLEGQGTIAGVEFSDTNASGVFDSGDAPIVGATVYLDINGNGALDDGDLSTLTAADGSYFFHVAAGNYSIRALGSGLAAPNPASHAANVEIGREVSGLNFADLALNAPTAIVLAAGSDTGAVGDATTRLNNSGASATLQFTVFGVTPGAQVFLYAGNTIIGSTTAATSEVVVTTNGTATLGDGPLSITALQSLSGVQSSASTPLSVVIDSTPPAAFTSTPPEFAQVGQLFSYDANSPDESLAGMSYSLSGAPAGMTIDSSGVVAWTPTVDQAVPQHFQIMLSDAAGNHVAQNVDLTVLGVIPAYPDEYAVNEDNSLEVSSQSGVLGNDGNATSGTLIATVVTLPAHGTVSLNPDGSFTYTPSANFFGVDHFTYSATNGTDNSNVAEVAITVVGQNDPPQAVADSYTTSEDVPLTTTSTTGLLANDSDVDADVLSASVASSPSHGTLTLHADGSFIYTPNSNYFGDDSFTYTLSDGTTTTDPIGVALHITAVNDPPTAVADNYTVNEDGTLTVDAASGVLNNDTDPDSSSLTAVLVSSTAHGSLVLSNDGSFTYTPSANYFGTDTFTYLASDGNGQSQSVTATITVSGQPDLPTAVADSATAPNDGTIQAIDVLSNDTSEPDGSQTLTIISVTQGLSGGVVAINGGSINYTGPVGFTGTDTFSYTIQDTDGLTSTATVTVAVADARVGSIAGYVYIDANGNATRESGEAGVPGVKVTLTGTDNLGAAVSQEAITDADGLFHFTDLKAGTYQLAEQQPAALVDGGESTAVAGAVVGNDQITNVVLAGGVDLTESNFGESSLRPEYISVLWFLASSPPQATLLRNSVAAAEQLAGNADFATAIRAGLTAMPASSAAAAASASAAPADEALAAASAAPDNTAPLAAADHYELSQDQTLAISTAIGLLANDVDADGDSLHAILDSQPEHVALTLASDGSFTYAAQNGFSGSDSFTYRAGDGLHESTPVSVSLTVQARLAAALSVAADAADNAMAGESDWLA